MDKKALDAINKFMYFSMNFDTRFIDEIWGNDPSLANHFKGKFNGYYEDYGPYGCILAFYGELSMNNQVKFLDWVMNNYDDEIKFRYHTEDNMAKTYNIGEYDTWTFIEENLPNYHQRDDILYNDLVSRYVNGEDMDMSDYEMVKANFGGDVDKAEKWLDEDIERLFLESVANAFKNNTIETISIS